MAAFDWSKTPVGPVETWPSSLKTVVRIMLDSDYPMVVWWGEERINLYNDAYIPVLGNRHPSALGQPARQIWIEIWDFLGPHSQLILTGQKASSLQRVLLILERNGFPEETYFTMSPSPIPGEEEGGIAGLVCVCTEHTAEIVSQRRLKISRDLDGGAPYEARTAEGACQLAASALAGNPHDLPFALVYLLDDAGTRARLAGVTRLQGGLPQSPSIIAMDDARAPWPLADVARTGRARLVDHLEAMGPLPGGAWPESPQRALVLPLATPGQGRPAGFLVAGLSPRLAFDDDYRGFLELAAGHIANAIANARVHTAERQRAEALAELDRAKDAFLAMLGHELRNPLTPILSALDLMKANPRAGRRAREVIERQMRQLIGLVDDLLDVARITRGKVHLTRRPVELADVVAAAVETASPLLESRSHHLRIDVPRRGLRLSADRQRLVQVIANLLSNAARYTDPGGQIAIGASRQESRITISVRDNGVGLSREALTTIFDPFVQERQRAGQGHAGLGLGLALVKSLVTLHGGTVRAQSEGRGRGSEFVVTLPALRARESPRKPVASGPPAPRKEPAGRRRVLLVDDNVDIVEMLALLLQQQHYEVATARDGLEAVRVAERFEPHVAIVDIGLPVMDGYEVARRLRKLPFGKQVRLIALTGYGQKTDRAHSKRAGFDVHLIKPVDIGELGGALVA